MTMNITIYTTQVCPYCVRAKELLKRKNLSYHEIKVDQDPEQREIMLQKSNGRRTVPQIFLNDHHVGGCDDLYQLEQSGELDRLLEQLSQS